MSWRESGEGGGVGARGRWGGVGLVGGSEWLTQFLMECRHGWLTLSLHPLLSFYPPPVYLSISIFRSLAGGRHPPSAPPSPPILSGLIVLHLFIQAFMAASSSRRPISPPDDGFLPQLSPLFIISVDPHHISLTLGRWFSHWTALPSRHITSPPGEASRGRTCAAGEETLRHYLTLQNYQVLKCDVAF